MAVVPVVRDSQRQRVTAELKRAFDLTDEHMSHIPIDSWQIEMYPSGASISIQMVARLDREEAREMTNRILGIEAVPGE